MCIVLYLANNITVKLYNKKHILEVEKKVVPVK